MLSIENSQWNSDAFDWEARSLERMQGTGLNIVECCVSFSCFAAALLMTDIMLLGKNSKSGCQHCWLLCFFFVLRGRCAVPMTTTSSCWLLCRTSNASDCSHGCDQNYIGILMYSLAAFADFCSSNFWTIPTSVHATYFLFVCLFCYACSRTRQPDVLLFRKLEKIRPNCIISEHTNVLHVDRSVVWNQYLLCRLLRATSTGGSVNMLRQNVARNPHLPFPCLFWPYFYIRRHRPDPHAIRCGVLSLAAECPLPWTFNCHVPLSWIHEMNENGE